MNSEDIILAVIHDDASKKYVHMSRFRRFKISTASFAHELHLDFMLFANLVYSD